MKNVIITFLNKHLILKNIISLSTGEFLSKIVSLVTFAYLARVISPEGFGIIGFSAAFVSYFVLFVDFGFDTYGVSEIAKNLEDQTKLINSIISTRIIISLFIFLMLVASALIFVNDLVVQMAIIIAGINLFVTAFSTNWYFHGIQKMEYIAVRQIFTSVLNFILIVIFVNNKADTLIAIFISGLAGLINSLWLFRIFNKYFGRYSFQLDYGYIKKIIKDSTPIALSSIMIAVYYNLDIVMLGFMKSDHEIGIYTSAVKVFLIGNVFYGIILKSFFPSLSYSIKSDTKTMLETFKKYFYLMISAGIITAACMYFMADNIITILYGNNYYRAISPLKIYAMTSLLVCTNMIFGNPLLAWGKQKEYLFVVGAGGISNIILNIVLIPQFSYIGASLATLFSEVSVFVALCFVFLFIIKNKNEL